MTETKPTALITGSAQRLGQSIAQFLATEGYNIALHYNKSKASAEATAEQIRQSGKICEHFQADLENIDEVAALSRQVQERFQRIDLLINNASKYTQANILDTSPEVFDAHFNIHIKAAFFLTQFLVKGGSLSNIINILDNKIDFQQFQYSAYLLSKKALAAFTHLAALELSPKIRVNAIAPGVILPQSSRTHEYQEWRIQEIPLKRKGSPQNIHQALQYILQNNFVNGQILTVDGGESLTHIGRNITTYFSS